MELRVQRGCSTKDVDCTGGWVIAAGVAGCATDALAPQYTEWY